MAIALWLHIHGWLPLGTADDLAVEGFAQKVKGLSGWLVLALFVYGMMRANWRNIQARDVELTKWKREAGETYTLLCGSCEVVEELMKTASKKILDTPDKLAKWTEQAKKIQAEVIPLLLARVTPYERRLLSTVTTELRPWIHEANPEHGELFTLLCAIDLILRDLAKKYEPALPWPPTSEPLASHLHSPPHAP